MRWIATTLVVMGALGACTEARPAMLEPAPGPDLSKAQKRELRLGQYYPDKAEVEACGALVQPITRESSRFGLLVSHDTSAIDFKDEEKSGADRIMTDRLRSKLDGLSKKVEAEWPGLKLRVTEAWDEGGEHGPRSLHYEGRAADLTTSDKDRRKLGRLAALAVESGFDWVFFEGTHVHASVKGR